MFWIEWLLIYLIFYFITRYVYAFVCELFDMEGKDLKEHADMVPYIPIIGEGALICILAVVLLILVVTFLQWLAQPAKKIREDFYKRFRRWPKL